MGNSLYKSVLTSHIRHKFSSLQGHLTSEQMATIPEFSWTLSDSIVCQNRQQDCGKLLHLKLQFSYGKKDKSQNHPKRERNSISSGRIPNIKLPLPSGICYSLDTLMCASMQITAKQESLPKLWNPEFLMRLHEISTSD